MPIALYGQQMRPISSYGRQALPGLPPKKHIQHTIQLKGAVPKAQPIHCLTSNQDNPICAYLDEALERDLSDLHSPLLEPLYPL
ncbi:hypothetical protein DSO57_1003260 [Entomophthora muscae]|uniref:Uncharacterized protein n=1 Tax=Entomophthora muscae TaxID=34485 RepID=A0ACC2SLA9_9FUNG|nr:hypothetical protein DSO57_1003260 [Entomophthora muscae]